MEDFPSALILASQEEVYHNNNVLYRLVKPLPNGSGIQSTDKLVNVVPFRRVYTFYHKQEVMDFEQLLLARPLVLQPVLHFGRGIGSHCGACYNDEPWVVMLNQTHPKILGRFQMGMDLAKQAIEKGQSVEMKFCFTNLIQRIYNEHLQQKEKEEAKTFAGEFLTLTRFAEWEHADLTIRYHGYEAKSKTKKDRKYHKTFHKEWDFDDIGSHEMLWNQIGHENFPLPHNSPVSEEELRAYLPSWTINEVSPLQDYGYELPKQNYSYSQAGRLYESFRKKKKQRPQNFTHNSADDHVEGAKACASSSHVEVNQQSPGIEHDFSFPDDKQVRTLSRARQAYMDQESMHYNNQHHQPSPHYANYHENEHFSTHPSERNELDAFHAPSRNYNRYENVPAYSKRNALQKTEMHNTNKHVDANVLIQTSKTSSQQEHSTHHSISHNHPNNYNLNSTNLMKRDSDRSHCSTNADSGYNEGQRSRGDSYDYNDHSSQSQHPTSKHVARSIDQMNPETDEGLDNPAFNYEGTQMDALERHKTFVAKMLAKQEVDGDKQGIYIESANKECSFQNKPQPSVSYAGNQKEKNIAESFI